MDPETKQAITRLAAAIDSVAGMTAGLAAYIATLDGAARVDRAKAIGISHKLVPEGVSGIVAPAAAARAMIEQVAAMAQNLQNLRSRLDQPNLLPSDLNRPAPLSTYSPALAAGKK